MNKQIYRVGIVTLIITFILAAIWEFLLKERFYPRDDLLAVVSAADSWSSVLSTTFTVLVALAIPAWLVLRSEPGRKPPQEQTIKKEEDEEGECLDGTGTVLAVLKPDEITPDSRQKTEEPPDDTKT